MRTIGSVSLHSIHFFPIFAYVKHAFRVCVCARARTEEKLLTDLSNVLLDIYNRNNHAGFS